MSDVTTNFWYVAFSHFSKREYMVFQADSLYSAEDRMDDLPDKYKVFPATWNDLKRLIGCEIPDGAKGTASAIGLLIWNLQRARTGLLM